MSSSLRLVTDQFPHLQDKVACLFEQDVVFRELCEDYEACRQALSRATASEDLNREYVALQLRLEYEMLRYINEESSRPGGAR